MVGTTGYMVHLTAGDDVDADHDRLDLIGGPQTSPHYPRGWAMAGNTPFRLYKINTHAGGHTVPFVMSWPAGGIGGGERRRQYAHVSDLAPTLLELVRRRPAARPRRRGGEADDRPLDGAHAARPGGPGPAHRGRLRDDRPPRLLPRRLGGRDPPPAVDGVRRRRVGALRPHHRPHRAAQPGRRAPRSWPSSPRRGRTAAWDGQIYPLDEGTGLKYLLRPPRTERLREPLTIWPGTPTLERWRSVQLIWLRSFSFEAPVTVGPDDLGTLVAHGDQSGGYGLYVLEGRVPALAMNDGRGHMTVVRGPALEPGDHVLAADVRRLRAQPLAPLALGRRRRPSTTAPRWR